MKFGPLFTAAALLAAAPAFSANVVGSTSAVFQNPLPATAVTTGIGSSSVTFGSGGDSNALTFRGTNFNAPLETAFKVGTLFYYNGSINADSGVDSIDLALKLNFSSPALPSVTSVFTFDVVSTPNNGFDPNADADYLYFPSSFSTTSFVIGNTTYNVKLTGFGNIVGDGFLASDSTQLHVREDRSATADVFAIVTTQTAAVPEPATWAMFIGGFGLIGGTLRRRQRTGVHFA